MTRREHLEWAQRRALETLERNTGSAGERTRDAVASMTSDLGKHPELHNHLGITLGIFMLFGERQATVEETRHWIEGFA